MCVDRYFRHRDWDEQKKQWAVGVAVLTAARASLQPGCMYTMRYIYTYEYVYTMMRVCKPTCLFSLSIPFECLYEQGRSKTDEIIAEVEVSRNPENGLLPLHT